MGAANQGRPVRSSHVLRRSGRTGPDVFLVESGARAGGAGMRGGRTRSGPRKAAVPRRTAAALTPWRSPGAYLRLHWSEANRFPGAVWSAGSLLVGLALPFALLVRYAGFPGRFPPVWLPLLDPLVHAAAAAALLFYFCRGERLDSWHLGLDRARIDATAGWTLGLLCAALAATMAALSDPRWIPRAPEVFAPAHALLRAALYEPGRTTRALSGLFAVSAAGPVGAVEEIILTGLLYPTLRRRWQMLPCALLRAAIGVILHVRSTECGVDPCLWPAAQMAAAQGGVALAAALAYEGWRTLWIPVALRAGFELARMAPGLAEALLF